MANPNFASILDEAPDEVAYPVSMPAGTYHCVVKGQPRYDKSSKKQTDFVEFTLVPQSAMDDVDADDLKAWADNKDGTTRKLQDGIIKATFYLTVKSVFRLDEFHEHCGIDLSVEASRRARNDECMNSEVMAVLRAEASEDGKTIFTRFARSAPVNAE